MNFKFLTTEMDKLLSSCFLTWPIYLSSESAQKLTSRCGLQNSLPQTARLLIARVNHKVFMPWGIRYRYIRTSSRDRTNSKFSILISDRRILEHLMMDRVFANIFTGYPKIFDIHIQICILCIVVIPTNCVPAYLITSYCTCT